MSVILQVRNLEKRYPGGVQAVAGVSFDVQRGQCLGLLGPNGAGKTTTVEMMEGILRPSGGEVLYNGVSLDAGYREVIGIQFQSTALQDFLTVKETSSSSAPCIRLRRRWMWLSSAAGWASS